MSEKKNRFAKELDQLKDKGEMLHLAIQYETNRDAFRSMIVESFGEENVETHVKKIPDFKQDFQA